MPRGRLPEGTRCRLLRWPPVPRAGFAVRHACRGEYPSASFFLGRPFSARLAFKRRLRAESRLLATLAFQSQGGLHEKSMDPARAPPRGRFMSQGVVSASPRCGLGVALAAAAIAFHGSPRALADDTEVVVPPINVHF